MIEIAKLNQMVQAEVAADKWWHDMSPREKQAYLKAHPKSKYGRKSPGAAESLRNQDSHDKASSYHERMIEKHNSRGERIGDKRGDDHPLVKAHFKAADLHMKAFDAHQKARQAHEDSQYNHESGYPAKRSDSYANKRTDRAREWTKLANAASANLKPLHGASNALSRMSSGKHTRTNSGSSHRFKEPVPLKQVHDKLKSLGYRREGAAHETSGGAQLYRHKDGSTVSVDAATDTKLAHGATVHYPRKR